VIRRILIIVFFGVTVGLTWTFVGHTPWAASLDVSTAGEQFTQAIEPLRMLAGALLIAVPSVMLVRSGWAWFDVHVLGNQPRTRVRPDLRRPQAVAPARATAQRTEPRASQRTAPGTPDRSRSQPSPATVPTR
jgi:hypothetical protein